MGWPSSYRDFDVAVTRRGSLLEGRVLDSPAGGTGAVLAPFAGDVAASDLGSGDESTGGGRDATRDVGPAEPKRAMTPRPGRRCSARCSTATS